MINGKQPRFHTFLLGFNVSIKSTKIPLSSFGQKIYITRISFHCCYTHNHISRKVPLFARCICDLSHSMWLVLQLIYFVCEQGNLTLQLQHPSMHVIATRAVRCTGVFWRWRNSAWCLFERLAGGKVGDISLSISKSIFKENSQLLLSLSGWRMSWRFLVTRTLGPFCPRAKILPKNKRIGEGFVTFWINYLYIDKWTKKTEIETKE